MTTRRNVLITGGSRGIGLFLATRMLARGDRVLVTGRSEASLLAAQAVHPHLEALVTDMSAVDGREALAAHIGAAMPELDLLVQNAGVQRGSVSPPTTRRGRSVRSRSTPCSPGPCISTTCSCRSCSRTADRRRSSK